MCGLAHIFHRADHRPPSVISLWLAPTRSCLHRHKSVRIHSDLHTYTSTHANKDAHTNSLKSLHDTAWHPACPVKVSKAFANLHGVSTESILCKWEKMWEECVNVWAECVCSAVYPEDLVKSISISGGQETWSDPCCMHTKVLIRIYLKSRTRRGIGARGLQYRMFWTGACRKSLMHETEEMCMDKLSLLSYFFILVQTSQIKYFIGQN